MSLTKELRCFSLVKGTGLGMRKPENSVRYLGPVCTEPESSL